ncbi:MAG TPA: hypothetical protein DDW92_02330 [Candidatus Veblenbacteria bacterium]|uniref:Uncharacterized protein n=1 Tax=Candidatus Veblenbacteria bacterium RIFOXYA2_FULL_43_9 TaxID=1802425 RepID=A0A1G2Q630_9BACT|nr:MAG: hypothetical protein A2226_01160 [Candidatus Veblenbacteria bacterium RIFOXYA2_FULL_43_9]HAO81694.1 hypothetical protein [Candidatus Veblenbacteria bacterium]HBH17073.1 hypothetical protein [Candidatus Veblenbacteria bacterium]
MQQIKQKTPFKKVWRKVSGYIYFILGICCCLGIAIGQLLINPPVFKLAGLIGLAGGLVISLVFLLHVKKIMSRINSP